MDRRTFVTVVVGAAVGVSAWPRGGGDRRAWPVGLVVGRTAEGRLRPYRSGSGDVCEGVWDGTRVVTGGVRVCLARA